MHRVRVSHVGSFPFKPEPDVVDIIVRGYLDAGVEAPSYPQLRNFIDMFLEPLVKEGLLEYMNGMYRIRDLNLFENARWLQAEPWEARLFAKKAKGVFQYMRAPVTGAYTLASSIVLNPSAEGYTATALADRRVVDVLADYVENTLRYLEKLGFNVLFIDEPMLSVIVGSKKILLGYKREDIMNYLNNVFSDTKAEHGLHVCGRISGLLFEILVSVENLSIINFEFYGFRENLKVVNRELLEAYSKKLSPGIASSKSLTVEPLEELVTILIDVVSKVGYTNIDLVSADDGFGGLRGAASEEELVRICFAKLRRIREAVNTVLYDEKRN